MRDPWTVLQERITRLSDRIDAVPSIREASVTGVAPLTVQFDTDDTGIETYGSLARTFVVGDRVLTLRLARYVWVLGVKNGRRYASGRVTITPSGAGVATAASITFPAGLFPTTPDVIAGVSSPVATVGVSAVTETGFTATIIRSSTTNTVVTWYAVLT